MKIILTNINLTETTLLEKKFKFVLKKFKINLIILNHIFKLDLLL